MENNVRQVNVCQSPPFFSIHLPRINAVKYSSTPYMIQHPAGQHSFVYCAETTTIQFLLLGGFFFSGFHLMYTR